MKQQKEDRTGKPAPNPPAEIESLNQKVATAAGEGEEATESLKACPLFNCGSFTCGSYSCPAFNA